MADHRTERKQVVKVRRSQVYAARARLSLDRQDVLTSPTWVAKLAAVDLHSPSAKERGRG